MTQIQTTAASAPPCSPPAASIPAGGQPAAPQEGPQEGPEAPSTAGEEDPGAALDDLADPNAAAPGVTPKDPVEVERKRQKSIE